MCKNAIQRCSIRGGRFFGVTDLPEIEVVLLMVSQIRDITDPKMHTQTKTNNLGNLVRSEIGVTDLLLQKQKKGFLIRDNITQICV